MAKIVLIAPPPIGLIRGPMMRNKNVTETYRNVCIKVANSMGVSSLDTWSTFQKFKPMDVLIDGLHLNKKGNRLLAAALIDLIRKDFPELRKENLPVVALDWKEAEIELKSE